jgi:hypothetical protein
LEEYAKRGQKVNLGWGEEGGEEYLATGISQTENIATEG